MTRFTGCGSTWLERSVRDGETGGSNPPTPMVHGSPAVGARQVSSGCRCSNANTSWWARLPRRRRTLPSYCTTTQLVTRAVLHAVFAGGRTLVVHCYAEMAEWKTRMAKDHVGESP